MTTITTPRILITVRNGVADYVSDPGIDVQIFDWDDYNASPDDTDPIMPAHFADLAEPLGIPVEAPRDPIYTNSVDGYGVDVFRTWEELEATVRGLIEDPHAEVLYFADDDGSPDPDHPATTDEVLARLRQGEPAALYYTTDDTGPTFSFEVHR